MMPMRKIAWTVLRPQILLLLVFWMYVYIAMRQRAGHNVHGERMGASVYVYTECNVCSLPDIILVCPFNSASHNFSHFAGGLSNL